MKKLFISQPMYGKTNEQIKAERDISVALAEKALGEKFEVIDSFFEDTPVNAAPLWFLAKSIEMLATADAVIFARGWETARGCVIEHMCATAYGLHII